MVYVDMILNNNSTINVVNGVKYLTFNRLSEISFIKHAFSTKEGGVSKNEFKSMNLSFSRGDIEEDVIENYHRFFDACGFSLDNIVMSDQVHDTKVFVVTKDVVKSLSTILKERKLTNIDGMITNVPNVPLITYYADCVPLYFVDVKNKAIGLSHSGWRGTVCGMGAKTVEAMVDEYNSNPLDIIAVIGPSICQKCYEVSKEVIDAVDERYKNIFETSLIYIAKDNGKYQLDLWMLNKLILKSAGLLEDNIIISDVCTSCNSDLLFSHRVTNGKRGNLAAIMEII